MENLIGYGLSALGIILVLTFITVVISRLYVKASKEKAFVRTGWRGTKVVKDGGALVLPVFHEYTNVNMNTMKLDVSKKDQEALITLDRMRVDVSAEFYVRVKPDDTAIGMAAQTLGNKTSDTNALKELVEAKFVDALRSVAASMTMKDLHEKRTDFVQKVQTSVTEDLEKNGLELESVSLTSFDQTNMKFFNPENAFDAEGLTLLTNEIENRRKLRNDIEQDTKLQIAQKNLEVDKKQAEVLREQEFVKIQTQKEIESQKAMQTTELAKVNANAEKESEMAKVEASRFIEQARLENQKQIETSRILIDQEVEQKNIEKTRVLKEAAIEQEKKIAITEQDKLIAIAKKSEEQAAAVAKAETARASEVSAKQEVATIEALAVAKRKQQVDVIEAQTQAQKETARILVEAEAEALAADKKATATLKEAEAEKKASVLRSEAKEKEYAVEAAGKKSINEASNAMSPEQVALAIKLRLLEQLPKIIEESVRPIQKIDSIKLVDMGGSINGVGSQSGVASNNNGSLPDQLVSAALKHKMASPLVDNLLSDIGINLNDLNATTKNITDSLVNQSQSVVENNNPDTV